MMFWLLVLLIIGGLAWIRFAPADVADWHVDPKVTADQDLANGVRRRIDGDMETLASLHAIILETPRTDVFAGTPGEGKVTYVSRSQWMGYPDYTTLVFNTDHLELHARARFGLNDLGVNKARVDGWLTRLAETAAE